ncbi:MAG TPA: spore coat protein CotJB [Paenibacillus cookii]|nr:spore coat protein CotJB [Paenibacillus cookii]
MSEQGIPRNSGPANGPGHVGPAHAHHENAGPAHHEHENIGPAHHAHENVGPAHHHMHENVGPAGMKPETKGTVDRQYYELLEQLQVIDFALVELNLYLDTHPDDLKRIEQYNRLAQERIPLVRKFQELYGPLMHFGHAYSKFPFEWPESPWPWQV